MKRIFTLIMGALCASTVAMAQNVIVKTVEKVGDLTAALNDLSGTKEAQLKAELENKSTLYQPGDVVYLYVKGAYEDEGAGWNLKTVYLPPCGNIHIIGITDEETGLKPRLRAEFILNKKDNQGNFQMKASDGAKGTWGENAYGNVEGDHFSLHFENLNIEDFNGPLANSKHFINAKDSLTHFVDTLEFKNCDIMNTARSFYRIEPQKLADGTSINAGDLGYFGMENCRFHYGSLQNNSFSLIYIPQPTTEMVFRNNTFYDLAYLNGIVTFAYMTEDTSRRALDFTFENNTVCARSYSIPTWETKKPSPLFQFATKKDGTVTPYISNRSDIKIKNNIFYCPWWADKANNRKGDTYSKADGGVIGGETLTEEEMMEFESVSIMNAYNVNVDIAYNFMDGYKAATCLIDAEDDPEDAGQWGGEGESNDLNRQSNGWDLDPVDFSSWEMDEFTIPQTGDNLSCFYTAGEDGKPIGDLNNYSEHAVIIVPVEVKIEGSKSAEVIVSPVQQAYKAGEEITLTAKTKGRLNTFEGWSNGETEEVITLTLGDNGLFITAKFKELDYVSAWNLEQLTKNNMKFAAPLAPNYGDETLTLNYARWQEATEAVEPTEENPEGVEAQPEGYRDVIENAIETRNNKVSGDLRNCFFISTPAGVFNTEGSHADYAYISIPVAKNGHHLQASIASDNIPYKHYTVDCLVEGTEEWVNMGSFEMSATGQWTDYDFALPAVADGKAVKVRIKGVEADGVFISPEMEEAGTEPTREFLFVSELYLVNGEPVIDQGITIVNAKEQQNAPIYNMMGIEVSNTAARGLYIQNGRKYVVK